MQHTDNNNQTPTLLLYTRNMCPYCKRVLDHAAQIGIKLACVDIGKDSNARDTLLAIGGKSQVPCLFINNKPLYESADIISYLDSLKGQQAHA